MNVKEVIVNNPKAVAQALCSFGAAGVGLYFVLAGHPDQGASLQSHIGAAVTPIATAITVVTALLSALHFSRGPTAPPSSTPQKS